MYFKQFSSKLCCFDDIKLFFNELSPEDTTQVPSYAPGYVSCITATGRCFKPWLRLWRRTRLTLTAVMRKFVKM